MAETQRPINAHEIGALHGVFQVMWKDANGDLYVHQLQGSDVRALLLNTPEGKRMRDSLFWHLKAAFLSVGAAVLGMPPVEIEGHPPEPGSIVDSGGAPYNVRSDDGSAGGGDRNH